MNHLKYLIIHNTATPEGREVTKRDIEHWHLSPVPIGRGWSRVGYSDLIQLEGNLVNLNSFNQNEIVEDQEMTWGVKKINRYSRHLVYAGGLDADGKSKDTRTIKQYKSMECYVKYTILRHPHIKIAGHNQFSNKDCPGFYVPQWLRDIGVNGKNIYL